VIALTKSSGFDYDAHKAKQAEAWRVRTKSGQNVAPIPEIEPEDLAERLACSHDFARFCKTYFPAAFSYSFSADHQKVIAKIENAVLHGKLAAFAMPRSYGKTTLSKAAALWAILYGHRRWVVMIGATGPLGINLLKNGLKPMLRSNPMLARAFPHTCKPARLASGSAVKASGLHHDNEPCYMVWEKDTLVFPSINSEYCLSGESRVTCFGIEGAIRGQVATMNRTGEEVRPDLVLVDDPQTKASARSVSMTQERYEIIMGDILGLAGGDVSIAGLIPCTVIQKGDLAERLLDPKESQEMNGERTKLVYQFPSDEKLWEEYFRLHSMDLMNGTNTAREMYIAKQEAMDLGCIHAWPERFPKEFHSAIEHAMYLRYREPDVFAAEYQNEPLEQSDLDYQFPTAQVIVGKTNPFERGILPDHATKITAFIDVQQNCLYWAVIAWEDCFTGYVLDYSTFPKQHQSYFGYRNLRHTLAAKYPGMGAEAAIFAAIQELGKDLLGMQWRRSDGATAGLSKLLIDSGDFTKTVGAAIQQLNSGVVMPSKGRGVKAGNVPFGSFQPRSGERIGDNWIEKPRSPTMAMRYVEYDTNHWKTFTQLRLATNMGDSGCLSLFKASPYDHRCIADHLTAEKPIRTEGHGRKLFEWILPPSSPDNHWLDCVVGCAVGASISGINLAEHRATAKNSVSRPTARQLAEKARRA
jgi:hypothetical protein